MNFKDVLVMAGPAERLYTVVLPARFKFGLLILLAAHPWSNSLTYGLSFQCCKMEINERMQGYRYSACHFSMS